MIYKTRSNDDSAIPVRIITPIGMLGYGFPAEQTSKCLGSLSSAELKATALILDSGSTDSGPSKLALGTTTCPRSSYKRDLTKLLSYVHEFQIPLIISSAGGDGSNAHVDLLVEIVWEIEREGKEAQSPANLKVLSIYGEINKDLVLERFADGAIRPCGAAPDLCRSDITECPTVVGQMGPEPFLDAMIAHPDFDVVIGGRAYDPSPYVAYCLYKVFQDPRTFLDSTYAPGSPMSSVLGGFYHMGKIMECGALCAVPKSASAMATMYSNGVFDVTPLDPKAICTPLSVAAHTLYEKSRPDILHGPGGELDLRSSLYESLSDGRSVRASGAQFRSSRAETGEYTLKLEGAKVNGFRTMFQGAVRDQILISQIEPFLEQINDFVESQHPYVTGETWTLNFHVYGKNGVMGQLEPQQGVIPHEIFVVGEVLASTQDLATAVASSGRIGCAHGSYDGQLATGGNFAFGLGGKLEIELGPCAEFAIYHLMQLQSQEEFGREEVDSRESAGKAKLFSFRAETRTNGNKCDNSRMSPYENVLAQALPSTSSTPVNGSAHKAEPLRNEIPRGAPDQANAYSTPPHLLREVARVIRSKNSGPYEITLDIIFENLATYRIIKDSKLLSRKLISDLYGLPEHEVITCMFFDQAMAFKATIPRKGPGGKSRASGGYSETDVQGSQQHAGLMLIELTEDIQERIAGMKS